jgi:predicted CXXCH cytochrome family protein
MVLVAVLLAIGLTSIRPSGAPLGLFGGLANAADPTPAPTEPAPTELPTAAPSAAPTAAPTLAPTPSPEPTAEPTQAPPTAAPSPTAAPPSPTAAPPSPTAAPLNTPAPTPTGPLAAPSAAATPAPTPTTIPSSAPSAGPTPGPAPTPLLKYALSTGQQAGSDVALAVPIYALVAPSAPLTSDSPHVSSGLDSPDCATCHAAHTATGPALVKAATPSELCFRCHTDGASFDVEAQFSGLPANDEASDAYFSHPVSAASGGQHAVGEADEFEGALERHAVCADCHNPHDANGARPQLSTTGWTASGAIRAAAGVAVTNAGAGAAPTYALVSRDDGASLTYEYELCLKCHSGYTTLPSRSATRPSWWALDKGIELNPQNASYHPVEAAGKNVSAQMAGSLAGTSPFKAWDFDVDSTVRCTSCHGDPATVNQTGSATPLRPAADAYEAAHGSPNRGLLIAPYRDRDLKAQGEPYAAQDFALCYLCHAERPFVDPNNQTSASDTAFPAHGLHLTLIGGIPGSGVSIDQAGAGEGPAICAECHFRVHSTAQSFAIGDTGPVARSTGYAGLVNFAPNVTAVGAIPPTWVQPNSFGQGSCTLTCHGYTHATTGYTTAPGTGFTATPTAGSVGSTGLLVQFTDASRYVGATGTAWSWDFGDGGTSTAQNPAHTYTTPGTFSVTLTVRRTSGNSLSMTLTKSSYITVGP